MIRHVVMWKFRPGCEAQAEEFMTRLAALKDEIEVIRHLEIRKDCSDKADHFTAMLISDFDSVEDMNAYLNDPRHKAVSALCKSIREDRACVDYAL